MKQNVVLFWIAAHATILLAQSPGTFTATGNMITERNGHTATLLNDGKVLIAGGNANNSTPLGLASAELYDPSAETFTPTGKMAVVRSGQFATLPSNGKVLIAQHFDGSGDRTEVYDPDTGVYDPDTGVFNETIGWKNSLDINGVSESVGAATVNSLTNGKILVTWRRKRAIFLWQTHTCTTRRLGHLALPIPPVYGPCEPVWSAKRIPRFAASLTSPYS
jgi:hypothetical protein